MAFTAPSRALTRVAPLVTLPALRLRIPDYGVLRAPHRHYCRFSHRIACIPSRAMCIVRSRGFAQSPELRLVAPFRCILLLCGHCSYPGWAHVGSRASIAPCSCSSRPHTWRFLHPWPPKRSPAVAVADPLSQHSSPAHLAHAALVALLARVIFSSRRRSYKAMHRCERRQRSATLWIL